MVHLPQTSFFSLFVDALSHFKKGLQQLAKVYPVQKVEMLKWKVGWKEKES